MNRNSQQPSKLGPVLHLLCLFVAVSCGEKVPEVSAPAPAKQAATNHDMDSPAKHILPEPQFFASPEMIPPLEIEKLRTMYIRQMRMSLDDNQSLTIPPNFHYPPALDGYPPRTRDERIEGMLTEKGLREAFREITGFEASADFKPVIGPLSSISSRPQFSVKAYYKVPPEQVEALAKKIADSWRTKFPVGTGRLPWKLEGPKPRPTYAIPAWSHPPAPEYGLALGPRTFTYHLEDHSSPGVDTDEKYEKGTSPHHTRSIVADPDSGLISLSHWEGDQD